MKKLLLSAILTSLTILGFSQPTYNFESWGGSGANEEPTGWVTGNTLVNILLPGNVQSVFKAASPDIHGGSYAMKIVSVSLANNPAPTQVPNPVGLAATGKASGTQFKIGFQYTGRPTSIDFWYRYLPVAGGDTASCLIYLWNGTSHDTIGAALWKSGVTTTGYTAKNLPIVYDPTLSGVTPDSMAIVFSSTKLFKPDTTFCMNCGKAGSILFVDDIVLNSPTGVQERVSNTGVEIYPQPAGDQVCISADNMDADIVSIYDITGKKIKTDIMQAAVNGLNKKVARLHTADWSAGLYTYTINDQKGNVLSAGKISVGK
jgi:hypothetical protein